MANSAYPGRLPGRAMSQADGVGAAVKHNQADGLDFLGEGQILNEAKALLQRSAPVLHAEMEVGRSRGPTLRPKPGA